MSESNGSAVKATGKYDAWAIVSDGRAEYVGQVDSWDTDGLVLKPAYEWHSSMSMDQAGRLNRQRICVPLGMFGGLLEISFDHAASVTPLRGLTGADEKLIAGAIESAEAVRASLMPSSGLIVAPPRVMR